MSSFHSGDPAEFFKDRNIVVNELIRKVWVHSEMVKPWKKVFHWTGTNPDTSSLKKRYTAQQGRAA